MAWTDPTTRTDGDLINQTIWNQDVVDNLAYLVNTVEPELSNKSGAQVTAGAVVTLATGNDSAFTTTTTAGDPLALGVAMETINNNASGRIGMAGAVTVNVQGNVTRGNFLRTSTTAGRAQDAGSTKVAGCFALALTAYGGGGAGTVTALLLPAGADSLVYKLVAPDGSPDPAWSVDSAGDLTNDGGGILDVNGVADAVVLDADGDTSLSAPTDDQIDFEVGGGDQMTLTSSRLTVGVAVTTPSLRLSQAGLTLSNGLNSDIDAGGPSGSFYRVTGPTGAFSIGGFKPSGGGVAGGDLLIIYNSTSQNMTIVNIDASTTAGFRIQTLTGADVTLTGSSSATFIYTATDGRWTLISTSG